MWGANKTYKLTQVSSVSAGKKYVFVQSGYAMTTISSSAIQTTTSYNTTGLAGNEAYVWELLNATGGFYMTNPSVGNNKYLKNTSSTNVGFVASTNTPHVWTFAFTNGTAKISDYSSNNRFLGWTTTTSHIYKAYATNNTCDDHPCEITVYELQEEVSCNSSITITKGSNPSNGTFTLTTGGSVCIDNGNASTTVNATPSPNYHLASVTSTGGGTIGDISNNSCTVTNIGANTTINVTFEADPTYTVTWVAASNSSFNTQTNYAGTDLTSPGTPEASTYCPGGKVFVGWTATPIVGEADDAPADLFTSVTGKSIPVDGITYYAVFATNSGGSDPETDTERGKTSTPYVANTGWTASAGGTYTSSGNYGASSPSIKFSANNQYIQSPTYSDVVTNISFWYKNQSSSGTLHTYVSTNGTSWTELTTESIDLSSSSSGTKNIAVSASNNYKAVKIVFTKSGNGNCSIDDIAITHGAGAVYSNYATSCCTPLGPINGSVIVNQTPTSVQLSWNAVDGAEKYQVKVPGSTSHNDWTDATSGVTVTGLACGTAHTAYFRAIDTNGSHCAEGPESTLAIPAQSWTVTSTGVTNVTASPAIPSTTCSGFNTTITASTGYALPSEITVTNADKTWNSSTGALAISNVTGNVTITIAGTCVAPDITGHPASANYVADPVAAATALSVTASAAGADLDYQWQSKVGEGAWTNIQGATNSTYTPSRTTAGVTQYRVVLTNHTCSESSNSNAATITVTVPSVCIAPTFDPEEGTYTGTQSVVLASETTGATVYYTMTTDGSEPATPTSGSTAYSSAISVTENTHIKAIAIKDGMQASSVAEAEYIIKCETPAISPAAGTYTGTKSVTITCATDDATIYYTTDGSTPDNTKTEYTGAFDVTNNQTVKAIAIKSNMANSAVASAAYLIKCETPVISPATGTHTGAQDVTITCATDGATIYYTTDGTDPDNTKTEYTGSFKVTNSKTVKAIAIKSGMENSAIASAAYTIQHTITWSVNGNTTTTSTVTDGNKLVLPEDEPATCNGSYGTFIGWYSSAAGTAEEPSANVSGTKADADHTPEGNETYYAVWGNGELVGGWQKVTSIAVGDVVIFVQETASKEMSNIALINTNMCGIATAYSTSPAGTYPLTIETGNGGSGYSFKTSANTYLSWSSNNTLTTSDTKNNASSWTISTSTDGNFKFANVATTERIMQFNNNSGQHRWACYGNDNQTAFQIYKQTTGATGFISNCCEEWTATAKYGESNVINVNDVVAVTVTGTVHGTASYESDDTDVLTVASDGKITGKKAGSATVTISWAGADGYCAYETTVDVTVNGTIIVTYNANDGSLTPATTSQNATSNSAFTLDANSFSRTGYTFQGWATTPSGAKAYDNSQANVSFAEDVTLYAVWALNSHAVTLTQPEGNEIEATGAANLANVAFGTEITLTATEEDGYVFTGWSATGVILANTNPVVFSMPDNDVTVTATYSTYSWIAADPRYTVTTAPKTSYTKVEKFSTAGVVIKENFKRSDDNTITKQVTYEGAWTAKLNGVAIANGADLSLEDNGKTLKLYIGEDEIESYTLTVSDIATDQFIDGLWNETFDVQTGTYDMPTPSSHAAGATDCAKHNTFAGWILEANAENPTVENIITGAAATGVTAANNTYYAVWSKSTTTPKEFTISKSTGFVAAGTTLNSDVSYSTAKNSAQNDPFVANNGHLRLYKPNNATYGNSITFSAGENMTIKKVEISTTSSDYAYKEGTYSTSGLSNGTVSDGKIIHDNLSNRHFSIVNTGSAYLEISEMKVTYMKSVTEVDYITDCDPRYEISFDANGGEGSYDKVTKKAGIEITLPDGSALSREHYTFKGWTEDEEGEGTLYTTTYTVPSENKTLYAQWTEDHFGTVSFKNGETTTSTIKVYDGGTYDLAAALVQAGKEFIGWKWDGDIYTAGQANQHMTDHAEDRTYTAVWMPVIDVATADAADLSDGKWILVEKKSQLKAGDFIVIAAAGSAKALSNNQKTSNRGDAAVTKIADTLTYTSNVAPLFLQYDPESELYALYDRAYDSNQDEVTDASGYLYANGGSTSNLLKTQTGITMQGLWAIDIADKKASIVAQGNNANTIMRYNSGSSLYTCYGSATTQKDIAIYKWAKNISSDMNVSDVTNTDMVIVTDGNTLTIDQSATLDNLIVEAGGEVSIAENKTLTVNTFTIESTMASGKSGQLNGATAVNFEASEAYIDITLGAGGTNQQWHAFTVPFPVDVTSGIYDLDGAPLTNEVNYAIMEYFGDERAKGNYGWKKIRTTLVPGTFYIMATDGYRTTYRFKKKAGAALVAANSKSLSEYPIDGGEEDKDNGWNGVGNPTLMYGKINYNAYVLDPDIYDYVAKPANTVNFVVGTPFFIQADASGSVSMLTADAGANYAPARVKATEITNVDVTFGNDVYTDHLYISASEDALNEYQIGKDLVKMTMSNTPRVGRIFSNAYGHQLTMVYAPLSNDQAIYDLSLYAPQAGTYSIAVPNDVDATIYLTYEGSIIWDLTASAYEIDLTKGTTEGYGLLLRTNAPAVVTGVDQIDAKAGAQKVIIDDHVYILRGGQMYDVNGKMVK